MPKSKSTFIVAAYEERIIWIDGCEGMTEKTALEFKNMIEEMNKRSSAPVIVYLSGTGGEFSLFVDMMQTVSNSKCPIACVAHDYAYSGMFVFTQCFKKRLAVGGTKFMFHQACLEPLGKFKDPLTQRQLTRELSCLYRIDATQYIIFCARAQPAQAIEEFIENESVISVAKAIKHKIIDDYYDQKSFLKDRRLISRIRKG